MLELILIRHGETENNVKGTHLGTTDVPLNKRGERQAQSTARIFMQDKIDAIYTSPLSRAMDTADVINKYQKLSIEKVFDISERNFGIWEDLTLEEIKEQYPEQHGSWLMNWADYVIPQGESAREVFDRNTKAIDDIIARHPNGKVIVVTHLGCIRNILAYLLGMGIEGTWHFRARNSGICRLEVDEYKFVTLTSFNEI